MLNQSRLLCISLPRKSSQVSFDLGDWELISSQLLWQLNSLICPKANGIRPISWLNPWRMNFVDKFTRVLFANWISFSFTFLELFFQKYPFRAFSYLLVTIHGLYSFLFWVKVECIILVYTLLVHARMNLLGGLIYVPLGLITG